MGASLARHDLYAAIPAAAMVAALVVCGTTTGARSQFDCEELAERLNRQSRINKAFRCELDGAAWRVSERQLKLLISRCERGNTLGLRSIAHDRSLGLEICLGERSDPDYQRNATRSRADQRILELLAKAPEPKSSVFTQPRPSDDASPRQPFNPVLAWSFSGPIEGMHCVAWQEPSDPHDWQDNYLCSERDFGFQWSFRGPVHGRGLNCTQVKEAADPHTWHDNFFCWPRNLNIEFRFSSTGRLAGYLCISVNEPSDPHKWYDNYLCHRPAASDDLGSLAAGQSGGAQVPAAPPTGGESPSGARDAR